MQAPVEALQVNFSRGEVDPLIAARTDLATANSSLRRARNCFVHPQGAISNRGGTLCVGKVKNDQQPVIVKEFIFNNDVQYCLEIGVLYIRFFRKDGSPVLNSDGSPYQVSTIYGADDIYQLKFNQSADVLYIYHKNYNICQLRRLDVDKFELIASEILNGPFLPANKDETLKMGVWRYETNPFHISSNKSFFTPDMAGGLMRVSKTIQAQEVSAYFPIAQETQSGVLWTSTPLLCKNNARFQILTSGTWDADILMQRSFDKTNWETIRTLNSNISANYNVVGAFSEDCWVRFIIQNWYQTDETPKRTLSFSFALDAYTLDLIAKLGEFISDRDMWVDSFQSPPLDDTLISTPYTDNWAEGAWNDKNGYPRCGCFYQDRHIVGGSKANPQGIWMSQTGYYNDFGVSSPLVDSDAISVNLPLRKINTVHNVIPMTDILALTSDAETIVKTEGVVMTPASVNIKPQTYRGSKEYVPMIVGNRVIYVQRGGYLRDISYNFSDDGYDGDDLRLFATHLFEGHEIIDIVYQQEPYSIIWAVRDDGKLCLLTYLREQQILAWTLCQTQGKVKAVCALQQDNFDEVWAVIERENGTFVERFANRNFIDDVRNGVFLDCATVDKSSVDRDDISGLERFNGMEVCVLNNGSVERGSVVDGVYTLKQRALAGQTVIVGLPYVSEIETLNIAAAELGSRKGKIFKIDVDFYRSRGGFIGTEWDRLDEIWQRTTELLGQPTGLYTQKYSMTPDSNNEIYKSVKIRQIEPLPITITGITPHLAAEI